jgi:pimeloyl-ACP methyl ester carboxylesterase
MFKRKTGKLILVIGVLLILAAVVPLLWPIPPLENARPVAELADLDSQFVELNGLSVHLKTQGQGEPVFVLLHGFGASLYSWNAVMEPFASLGTVIAYDRPAFGLTERPMQWQGQNPYSMDAQVDLLVALLDHFGVQKAILVGNSAGGTVAMQTALAHPERVSALVLVDPAIYSGGGAAGWLKPLLATPQARRLGPLFVRQTFAARGEQLIETAWHDPARIQPQTLELYRKPLQVENWDRALWEFTLASQDLKLDEKLNQVNLPVLVVTGDDDRIVPTADSIRLAGELPEASLAVIPQAGHVPHEEKPDVFIAEVWKFFQKIGIINP